MLLSDLDINLHCTSTSTDVPAVQILWKSTQRFLRFHAQKIFYQKFKKTSIKWTILNLKKSKNILAILFLHILHMPSFKKIALIATEISSKTSAETAETATDPKTIPPAVFQKRVGGKNK